MSNFVVNVTFDRAHTYRGELLKNAPFNPDGTALSQIRIFAWDIAQGRWLSVQDSSGLDAYVWVKDGTGDILGLPMRSIHSIFATE